MLDVTIVLLCTRKAGTLSRLIREVKLFGLQYAGHQIDYPGTDCLITVVTRGELNCTRARLIELFSEVPEVIAVQAVNISRDGDDVSQFRTSVSEAHISAHEPLSPAILHTADKRLSDIVGPVASFLVETAAQSSQNVGELYLQLAEELDDPTERREFLSIIEKLK